MAFLGSFWHVMLDSGPWLIMGLLIAGLIKAFLPQAWLQRWLGGRGVMPIIRAAIVGTPLPLCSCSVVPAALALRRGGASKGSTVSFLISTPENGADSIALSWAMLGPFMTVVRPVAGITTAVTAGLLTALVDRETSDRPGKGNASPVAADGGGGSCCDKPTGPAATQAKPVSMSLTVAATAGSCCSEPQVETPPQPAPASCCSLPVAQPAAKEPESASCCATDPEPAKASVLARLGMGVRYGMTDLFDDIAGWMLLGLILAAAIHVLVPAESMAEWGSGLPAMLLMLLAGVPMYICATASTPVAASLMVAGVSPGTVLVLLLAGPATNMGTLGIIRQQLGTAVAATYVVVIGVVSIGFGLATDALAAYWSINPVAQAQHQHGLVPEPIAILGAIVLLLMFAYWLWGHQVAPRIWRQPADTPDPAPAHAH